ncbi:chaplin [Streptomyces physcomitrii]|uniref:Chaplin n=1 Tax=Streptomyces physcomitrii TaxID=2724184 RepID=A0ABX1H600_9ACTN|nr:chaplin [Streptomyces physcomitrii]NKI43492.1 chaplin [Streptomyces physcomitrii]
MRQVTRKGLLTVAAATGVIAVAGGYAHADSHASGGASDSPGVASGNTVQVPVNVPVNVCGNTIDVAGLLNPAAGNTCVNGGGDHGKSSARDAGTATTAGTSGTSGKGASHGEESTSGSRHSGGAHADGEATDSPGVLSGNQIQAPIDIPVNACGNSVNVAGLLNPAAGNDCANNTEPSKPPVKPEEPPVKHEQPPAEQPDEPNAPAPQTEPEQLAHTGNSVPVGAAAALAAGAVLGGAVLYRRSRVAA